MTSLSEFYEGGPNTWNEAFPPICVQPHWNPEMLSRHVLPSFPQTNALDPRPASKICTAYVHSSAGDSSVQVVAQPVHTNDAVFVFPPGGKAGVGFPYDRYQASVESEILRLKEPLTKCAERKYLPTSLPPATNVLPGADSRMLSPYSTEVRTQAGCRAEDDSAAWNRSSRLFFNPTKYDRTTQVPSNLSKSESRYNLSCR